MTIIDQIKEKHKAARLSRDTIAASILSVVLGDIQTKEKNGKVFTDADVIAMLKSFIDDIVASRAEATGEMLERLQQEQKILSAFVPTQLTVPEITAILQANGIKSIPDAQKYMRANHAGTFNGADVNKAFAAL